MGASIRNAKQGLPTPDPRVDVFHARNADENSVNQPTHSTGTSKTATLADELKSRVVFTKSHWRGEAIKDLRAQLVKGDATPSTLPETYLESERIVEPLSPEGMTFQRAMEGLTKRLLPDVNLTEHPITFVIADAGQENAYIVPTPQQSLICFDRALLKTFDNLDQLSWVLLHELTHMQYRENFGATPNTQIEEGLCDLRPLIKMMEAGLNPAEAETYAMKMAERTQAKWMSMVDVHALPEFRVDAISKGLVALRQSRGQLPTTTEALPKELQVGEGLRNAVHRSFIDRSPSLQDYTSKSAIEKLQAIQAIIPTLDPRFYQRAEDLAKHLKDITITKEDKDERAILITTMDSLLDNPSAFNVLHPRIRSVLDGSHQKTTRYYAPRIVRLAKAIAAFIEAADETTTKEKADAAAHLITTLESLPSWQSIQWGLVDLPRFELADERDYKAALKEFKSSGEDVIFPWHELAEAAKPDNQISRALLCLGTWDDRIPNSAGVSDLTWMHTHLTVADKTKNWSSNRYEAILSTPQSEDGEMSRFQLVSDGAGLIKKLSLIEVDKKAIVANISKHIANALDREKLTEQSEALALNVSSPGGMFEPKNGIPSFMDLPYHEFLKDPYTHLRVNEGLFCPLDAIPDGASQTQIDTMTRAAITKAVVASRHLTNYFDGMLSVSTEPERTQYRNFVKEFFLSESTPFNYRVIASRQIEDNGYTSVIHFLDWAASDRHQLFTLSEKGQIFWEHHSASTIRLARTACGVSKPTNMDELLVALDLYLQLGGRINQQEDPELALNIFVSETMSQEINSYLREHGSKGEIHRLLSAHGEKLSHLWRDSEFDPILVAYLKKEENWPTDPTILGTIYRAVDGLGVFPDEQWRTDFAKRVMASIDATQGLDLKGAALENLLLGPPLKDVDIRDGAISRWVEYVATQYGDDTTPTWNTDYCPYLNTIQARIDHISQNAHSSIRATMLNALGNRIVAQRQVSHALEKAALGIIDESMAVKSGKTYGTLQTVFGVIGGEKEARFRSIHFLTRPLTAKSLRVFAKSAIQDGVETATMFGSEHYVDPDSNRFRRRIELECKRLHDNFWSSPMAYRATFLEDLLMPAEQRLKDRQAGRNDTFDQACDYVIKELLPLTDRKGNPIKYAPEAQQVLRAFLAPGVLDHRQQPVFLSALMASAQRSNDQAGQLSVGQRLATIFDAMGPAWKKFGQAISSHPSTPLDIARDMEPLKGKNSITRAEAWALYEHTVPEEIRLQNPRLGKVLESASFFTAVDAGDEVFTFLTPNALVRAEDGFSIMENFVAELRKADDSFSQVAPAVAEMVHSARTSAVLETNGRVGASQADAMRSRYDNLTVTIGTQPFSFATAAWRDNGPEFRRMQKMKGPTFNDLPSTTAEEALHKRQVAKAILYVELRNILSGGAFCPDRHGRNMRVDGNSVGHFDHGAVHAIVRDKKGTEVNPLNAEQALINGGSVEIPGAKPAEKLQLAEALYSSYTQLSQGQPLAVVLHNEIEKARAATGTTPDFLIRVERALLALNDCFKCLDSNGQDIKDILGNLYLNGDIDTVITTALEKKLSAEKLGAFSMFINASKAIRKEIENMVTERITVSIDRRPDTLRSQWHEIAKNRQDVPTLLTTKDFRPKSKKPEPKPDQRRESLIPTFTS